MNSETSTNTQDANTTLTTIMNGRRIPNSPIQFNGVLIKTDERIRATSYDCKPVMAMTRRMLTISVASPTTMRINANQRNTIDVVFVAK